MTDVIGYLSLVVKALDAIGEMAGSATVENASDVLNAIIKVYDVVKQTYNRKVTPEAAHEEIVRLTNSIKSNDDAADAALAKKFADKE